MASQGLLFSEPSIAETGVWCNLSEGIDPAEWAMLCRYIGTLNPKEFEQVRNEIMPDPDVANRTKTDLQNRGRRLRCAKIVGKSGFLTYLLDFVGVFWEKPR